MKFLLWVLILINLSYADIFAYTKGYYKSGGNKDKDIQELYKKDIHFIKGNKYLTDKDYLYKKDIHFRDPENKNSQTHIQEVLIPYWSKALKEFVLSVKKYKNPISAYEGLYIIKTKYPLNGEILKEYKLLAETLYLKNKKMCAAALYFGEIFEYGYYHKVDYDKALKIYKKASNLNNCTDWQKNILYSKIIKIEKIKKHNVR